MRRTRRDSRGTWREAGEKDMEREVRRMKESEDREVRGEREGEGQ